MANNEVRFLCSYLNGEMVKFSEDHIVLVKDKIYSIPYECISKLDYSSVMAMPYYLTIETNDKKVFLIAIQEKKAMKQTLDGVLSKINKNTKKKIKVTTLTDEDNEFIKIATKIKRKENVTEEEKKILGYPIEESKDTKFKVLLILTSVLFFAIALFGVYLLFNGSILFSLLPLIGGVGIVCLIISNIWEKINIKASFVITFIAAIFIGIILFGPPHKEKNNSKDGFIGSDGEYHEYVPEFGDDVNNWMEENW